MSNTTEGTKRTALVSAFIHEVIGFDNFVHQYNAFRVRAGKTRIECQTIRRYTNGGVGYENGPPSHMMDYIKRYVYGLLSTD